VRLGLVALAALGAAGCFGDHAPAADPRGRAPASFDAATACSGKSPVRSHVSFPSRAAPGCATPVRYEDGGRVVVDAPAPTCAYEVGGRVGSELEREAARLEAIAGGSTERVPLELRCLGGAALRNAAAHDARVLRATLADLRGGKHYPYAAIATPGFGHGTQGAGSLVRYSPSAACPSIDKREMDGLSHNVRRAHAAAEAWLAGVAPVVIVSGGAVQSPLAEAHALHALLRCRFSVPSDRVYLDPCADHTHTNLRNIARAVLALGGERAYVVTDPFQAAYLRDWTWFDAFGGSIDQRSLRDFGYLVGSYRMVSEGKESGFWFTPYRFWGETGDLARFQCVDP
jgi:hypothetical protein